MKFFLSSARLEEVQQAYEDLKIDGLTIGARDLVGVDISLHQVLKSLSAWVGEIFPQGDHFDFPILIELAPHLADDGALIREALQLRAISPFCVVGVPCTIAGVRATYRLSSEAVPVNMTMVSTPMQAIVSARCGASFVSPSLSWRESCGGGVGAHVREVTRIYKNYSFTTEVLTVGLQSVRQIEEAALAGADAVSFNLHLYREALQQPFAHSP